MTTDEVLLLARSLLRDDDYKALRFSDKELLDVLERVQNDLILLFRENIHTTHKKLKKTEFELPHKVAQILSVKLNNIAIPFMQSHRVIEYEGAALCYAGFNRYALWHYPISPSGSDELDMVYCAFVEGLESGDELALDSTYKKALGLGIVCEMLLREPSEQNLQRSQYYKSEYEKEKGSIRVHKNATQSKRVFATKVFF